MFQAGSAASTSPSTETYYAGMEIEENLELLEDSECITVTVGSQNAATTWHLPKELLLRKSPFFAKTLSGSFTEANLDSVTMPEDDPNVFRRWVQWLFVGRITCEIVSVGDIDDVLVKAWLLGNKLGCRVFQDVVMMELLACHSPKVETPLIGPSTLRAAYEGSAYGTKLRQWALDFFLFLIRQTGDDVPSALLRNAVWASETVDIEDFSRDFMEASMELSLRGNPVNPYTKGQQYMEVLSFTRH